MKIYDVFFAVCVVLCLIGCAMAYGREYHADSAPLISDPCASDGDLLETTYDTSTPPPSDHKDPLDHMVNDVLTPSPFTPQEPRMVDREEERIDNGDGYRAEEINNGNHRTE